MRAHALLAEGGEVALRSGGGIEGLLLLAGSTSVASLGTGALVELTALARGTLTALTRRALAALTRRTLTTGAIRAGTTAILRAELGLLTNNLGQRNEVLLLLSGGSSLGGGGSSGRGGSLSLRLVPVGLDDAGLTSVSEGSLELLGLLGLLGTEGSERDSLDLRIEYGQNGGDTRMEKDGLLDFSFFSVHRQKHVIGSKMGVKYD